MKFSSKFELQMAYLFYSVDKNKSLEYMSNTLLNKALRTGSFLSGFHESFTNSWNRRWILLWFKTTDVLFGNRPKSHFLLSLIKKYSNSRFYNFDNQQACVVFCIKLAEELRFPNMKWKLSFKRYYCTNLITIYYQKHYVIWSRNL